MVKLNIGDKAKVVKNGSNHCWPLGSIVTIKGDYVGQGYYVLETGSWFKYDDLEAMPQTKEGLAEVVEGLGVEIARLNARIAVHKSQIQFMEETGQDIFCEKEFQAYHTLKVLEQQDLSLLERAKQIAALFRD